MALQLATPPTDTPLINIPQLRAGENFPSWLRRFVGDIEKKWSDWLILSVQSRLQSTSNLLTTVSFAGKAAAIAATAFPLSSVASGLYRITGTLRLSTAATISSSVSVTIAYTRNAVACSQTSTALTANDITKPTSVFFDLRVDAGTAVTYAVSYASVGGTAAVYEGDLSIEQIGA